jgi:hypothetical protein
MSQYRTDFLGTPQQVDLSYFCMSFLTADWLDHASAAQARRTSPPPTGITPEVTCAQKQHTHDNATQMSSAPASLCPPGIFRAGGAHCGLAITAKDLLLVEALTKGQCQMRLHFPEIISIIFTIRHVRSAQEPQLERL